MSLGPVWATWIDSVFKVSKKEKSISRVFILSNFKRTIEPTVERKIFFLHTRTVGVTGTAA